MPNVKETVAYLSLGSNMEEREAQIEEALASIERIPETKLLRRSPLYESKPWGKTDQPDFLNMVAEISTRLAPHLLLKHCKSIEVKQGREPGEQWGPRPIDIDILLYGDKRLRTATLVLPHQRLWEREFVLRPLADLLPNLLGPDNATIDEFLKQESISSQGVRPFKTERKLRNAEK